MSWMPESEDLLVHCAFTYVSCLFLNKNVGYMTKDGLQYQSKHKILDKRTQEESRSCLLDLHLYVHPLDVNASTCFVLLVKY